MLQKSQLRLLTPLWLNLSMALKRDPEADQRFGWVLEMWGYSLAAAALGVKHTLRSDFQREGGAGMSGKATDGYIFHYTYGIEYSLKGQPMTGAIGEWSLDKRHYGGAYPPRQLQPLPEGVERGRDVATFLLDAWNEASAQIDAWPLTHALGTVGWRRNQGDGIEQSDLAKRVEGSAWSWAGIEGLRFNAQGELKTPWGVGIWGVLAASDPKSDGGHCAAGCLFADFSGALHNLAFHLDSQPPTFVAVRVGDGERVHGKSKALALKA